MFVWKHKIRTTTLHFGQTSAKALTIAGLFLAFSGVPALADLRVCNKTGSTIGLAIGYELKGEWISEGWWNLEQKKCETVLKGILVKNRYFIHAIDYDKGGQWNGETFLCTQDLQFQIKGTQECVARGFERTGFFEIDTAGKQDYTVQLTDQE
ncbi:DUF1036 domain-containing protein [Cohaesibacter celericrescens]|jgi:uncharacterized membrane protein|uniref:DUF1036 domain-containing protein n=1 Tax=Cohaesibacter celericrescens TaxID=2067669 RepID=A0A2N5XWS9_9HYPH|nr:DUF1036 domain-containing protein [Cohaesibacter celericrescens]PLW78974.1 hypothetical protein C0081_01685 [Cohaesibacter celericrescens]